MKLVELGLVVGTLGAVAFTAYNMGYDKARSLGQDEVLKHEIAYRNAEVKHKQLVSKLRQDYETVSKEATELDSKLADSLTRSDSPTIMRLPAKACASSATSDSPSPSTSRAHDPETAELTPEAAQALWAIAVEGDAAIRQLTALQDWADNAVKLCGKTD